MLSRRRFLERAAAATGGFFAVDAITSDRARGARWPPVSAYSADVPAAWFDLALQLVRTTPGFSPPVASRAFGYAGVALHEALVPGMPRRVRLAGRLNGLKRAPRLHDGGHHWPSVANSALATMFRLLFPTASAENVAAIGELERRFAVTARAVLPIAVYRRSAARGVAVARHVFEWSKTDGGHEAFLRGSPPYVPPTGEGLWVPTPPVFAAALQPAWGTNRPFALRSADACAPGPPPPYSEVPESPFYNEALECYRAVTELTPEQEAIARFWSDDPGQTATPPGHSVSILTQVVRARGVRLHRAAEAYAKVGVAVADAFIACWRTKYRYNVVRPITYVRRLIDPAWTPLLATPPFPEYTSGHSVQSAAAATVMTELFGTVAFTDHTHDARGLPPRSFASFMDAAREAAISRMYGGIHFRAAIERGLEQGACVGVHASAL